MSKPNIIFILADDHGHWGMGCAGNGDISTPNLDRIAASGIRFDNFFCASPVCSPARASLLTGRIPSQHGVHDWLRGGNSSADGEKVEPIEYLEGLTGYTDILAANGYTCGMSGKWHLGDAYTPQKGLSFWEVHAKGGGPYYNAPVIKDGKVVEQPGYVTDYITDNALQFLRENGTKGPFYLSVHYTAPHSPWDRGNHPDDVYDDYRENCDFDFMPRDPMHKWQVNSAPSGYDEEARRDIWSGYFAAVTAMDTNIGRILHWLEQNDLLEDTLVFFTSDNGMNMGHHGIFGKGNGTFPMNMYDTSVKVPTLISHPGHIPEGEVCDVMLSHYDFMPTLLDYVGLRNPEAESLPGKSFAPLLRGEKMDGHDEIVIYDEYGPVRMIRTQDWKYVHRYPYGPHELYNLKKDPDERDNLYDDPKYADRVREMRAGLEEWFARYADPMRDGRVEAVTGKGQIGLVGPAGEGKVRFRRDVYYYHDDTEPPFPLPLKKPEQD